MDAGGLIAEVVAVDEDFPPVIAGIPMPCEVSVDQGVAGGFGFVRSDIVLTQDPAEGGSAGAGRSSASPPLKVIASATPARRALRRAKSTIRNDTSLAKVGTALA